MRYRQLYVSGVPVLVETDPAGSGIEDSDDDLAALLGPLGLIAEAVIASLDAGEGKQAPDVDVAFGLALREGGLPVLTRDHASAHFRVNVRLGSQPKVDLPKL